MTSPGGISSETSCTTGRPPRATVTPESRSGASLTPLLDVLGAEVRADDLLVAQHLGGRAGGDELAEVEDGRDLAAGGHEAHVVVDEDHERARVLRDAADDVPEVLGLLVGQAGGGLVEEDERGACRRPRARPRRDGARGRRACRPWRRDRHRRGRRRRARRARRRGARRGCPAASARGRARRSPRPKLLDRLLGLERRRSPQRARRKCGIARRSSPSAVIRPDAGATKPLRTLKNVVLPAPFGPIRPQVPCSKRTVMPSSGVTPPNRTVRSSISISARAPLRAGRGGTRRRSAPTASRGPSASGPRARPARSAAPAARRRRTGS